MARFSGLKSEPCGYCSWRGPTPDPPEEVGCRRRLGNVGAARDTPSGLWRRKQARKLTHTAISGPSVAVNRMDDRSLTRSGRRGRGTGTHLILIARAPNEQFHAKTESAEQHEFGNPNISTRAGPLTPNRKTARGCGRVTPHSKRIALRETFEGLVADFPGRRAAGLACCGNCQLLRIET